MDLVTNGVVITDAIKFVKKNKEKEKLGYVNTECVNNKDKQIINL